MEEINSHTDYICQSLNNPGDRSFKIRVHHITTNKISIIVLETSPYGHCVGYYKWWFIGEFFSLFKLIPVEEQTPKEIIDELFISGEKNFRELKKVC